MSSRIPLMAVSPGSPSLPFKQSSSSSSPTLRIIPGSYGWPLIGPIKDRLDYFWFEGAETFYRKRMEKHKSTVFRTNVPPCFPLFTGVDPRVIAVLDVKSFSHLFDMEIVEKKDVLVGDFMPSLSFTGDLRVCAYLDTAESKHSKVKSFLMDVLKRSSTVWVPTLTSKLDTMWDTIESELATSDSAGYFKPLQQFLFSFLTRCLIGADTSASKEIAESGYFMIDKWLALMLLPTVKVGLPQPLEEIFLHSFRYPFALVKNDYNKLITFIETEGRDVIQRGQSEFNLTKQEALHNLMFTLGFNALGGFSIFLPTLLKNLESGSPYLQQKLREEVRGKIKSASDLSFDSVKELDLVNSFVYETLRFAPPVPNQFARARKDFKLSSNDSIFEVKKGELLCGFQKLVMRDPNIFDDPETFVPDRFTKEKGRALLEYLFWSNGPQTGSPGTGNKQCPGKDLVTLTASLFLAHLFTRYDTITCSSGSIKAVEKRC